MKNVLNLRWLVFPLMLMILAAGNVRADVSDVAITASTSADSIVEVQEASSWHAQFNQIVDDYSFEFSILASMAAAIFALMLFFRVLRPKVEIYPKIAVCRKRGDSIEFQILLKNKSFSSCNDIRIFLSHKVVDKNGDSTIKNLNNSPIYVLSLRGKCHDIDSSSYCLTCQAPKDFSFNTFRVSTLGQHAVSSIVSGEDHTFSSNDCEEGEFIQGVLVKKGCSYKEMVLRENSRNLKWVSYIFSLFLVVIGIILYFITAAVVYKLFAFVGCALLLIGGCTIWQLHIQSKANSIEAKQSITVARMQVLEIHEHKHEESGNHAPSNGNAEEVPFVEATDEDKNTKKPLK